jgi:hypothetical protein
MKIEFVTLESHPRRSVAFLISSEEKVTAHPFFKELKDSNLERTLLTRFDAWKDGLVNDKWFHGWTQSQFTGRYTNCFVFKCKIKRLEQRLYGFLCNPKKGPSDRGYRLCVLVRHASKNEWETDEADLKIVEEIRTTLAVRKIIDDHFKESHED